MIRILGIVNVTPDSFWAGSRVNDEDQLLERVRRMLDEGAYAIDIGGCSTRPGSSPVSQQTEYERLQWCLDYLKNKFPDIIISVDTFRPDIALHCVREWDVSIINDVSGGNPEMYRVVAETGTGYVLTFSELSEDDPVACMSTFFSERIKMMEEAGIDVDEKIILDPGFGFGKSLVENYKVLAGMDALKSFGLPVMAGVSRKSMAFKLLGISPEQSVNATTVLNTLSLTKGATWLRVHDVAEAVEAVKIFEMYNDNLVKL